MKRFIKHQSGFTIIELVMSSMIIIIISTLVVVNFRNQTQKVALEKETERLSGAIRQVHINALTGLLVDGSRPTGGFGIHLEECSTNCQYTIFADQDSDYIYDDGISDDLWQTLGTLDDNVYVADLTLDPDGAQTELDITFTSPKGDIYLNGLDDQTTATIILGFQNHSLTKTITFDATTGRVHID